MYSTSDLLALFHEHPAVSTDTRKIQAGDLYVALKGARFDGNQYAQNALETGASFAIVDDASVIPENDDRYILVENGLKALQDLATAYRREFDIPIIGITGSNGKTTTKELMHAVLATEKKAYATAGNFNNHIGVPLTLLGMPRDTEIAIIEMGANQPRDIAELSTIAEPTHGVITNIGHSHLERLGSIDGVQKVKGELPDFIRAHDGLFFQNAADERVVATSQGIKQLVSFGTQDSDYWAEIEKHELTGMTLNIHAQSGEAFRVESQMSGSYNAHNMLAAAVIGLTMGISVKGVQGGIAGYVPTNNRSQIIRKGEHVIWMDAYNANPSSMKAAIRHLFDVQPEGVALVLGDMFELGEESKELHADLGKFISAFTPVMTVGVGSEMHAMIDQLSSPKRHYLDITEAAPTIWQDLASAKVILIKGSRGMALEKVMELHPLNS
ncbi:UDP-N-acetylmuramoyl-tripeptide--D-alanyl-D-alanine ligase [Pontibacter sp. G13]|uniref:UDP-N-acetylmuramoyl-tripeptide--D-alanyl-D- alanine ligase n=1 Tax=Pontibacter sp. G13 TaxID=3074898 RepID=UPI00288A761F|nr:UDP-N-acetylmuramoyl-tripeptide--D-alanyl-D-alanine ligase [Pontibacter sp. G13]WNJ15990.1 UDP-N-acetylmuramoyl-tripeptide--D-alanyl-D-alanine ligase [Pontibacter sp. G13]